MSESGCPTFAQYAGFPRRLGAFVIDMLIVNGFWMLVTMVAKPFLISANDLVLLAFNMEGLAFCWLYHVAFETSLLQATPGKLAFGLKVTGLNGERIRFLQASARYWSQFLSVLTLLTGYLMLFWSPRKQTLHDWLAHCVVIVNQPAENPVSEP